MVNKVVYIQFLIRNHISKLDIIHVLYTVAIEVRTITAVTVREIKDPPTCVIRIRDVQ